MVPVALVREDVIDHAIYFRFSPYLYHQTAKELKAILVVVQADLAVQDVPEVQEVLNLVDKRNVRIIKEGKSWWRWIIGLISSSVPGVISWD